jgi:cytochrome c oxidase cbb3-type subunit 3
MTKKLLIGLGLLLVSFAQTASAAPDGEKLYHTHCAVCHNNNGIGGIGLPLNGIKVAHFPRDYLFKTIRLGREGRVMPAFDFLSDAQVDAIVDHILKWRFEHAQDKVFSPEPIEGDVERGLTLYQEHCAECHGVDGKSQGIGTGVTFERERDFEVVPPALNNPGFLASATDHWIRYTVQTGRLGTIMPSQTELKITDQDVNDIVAFVRSFEKQYLDVEEPEAEPPTLVYESPYDFETTVSNIKQALHGTNFRIFPDRFMEMGLAPDDQINRKQLSMRFCNFSQLYTMINTEPRLGVVLPCRVTVVEDDDGSVKIYVMNMRLVSRLFNNEQLSEFVEDMVQSLSNIIDEATL